MINLKNKVERQLATFSGKKEKPPATGSPVAEVEVPQGYRDPSPFTFKKGDTVAILGNGLADRMQHDGWTETLLQSELKSQEISFRMGLSGDRPDRYPRNKVSPRWANTSNLRQSRRDLRHVRLQRILLGRQEAADSHKKLLIDFVAKLRSYKPNGEEFPRIVLFSPIAFENLKDRNPRSLSATTKTSPLSPRQPRMPPERRAWLTSTCSSRA